MKWQGLLVVLALTGCPERTAPERGLQLVYKKSDIESVRATVDRRLAQLKVRANLSEDDATLTVRVPEGAEVSRIKKLLAQRGQLEFCSEDPEVAAAWCGAQWPAGVSVDSSGDSQGATCALVGASRDALEASLADAGARLAWGTSGLQAQVYSFLRCISPRVVSAEPHPEQSNVALGFDRSGGKELATLTTETTGRRVIIRLDDVVLAAPLVREPITGGKAMVPVRLDAESMELLAASLVGGPLPVLVLVREGTWGPPSLISH